MEQSGWQSDFARLADAAFVPSGEIVIGLDETIERRWGRQIKARGIYRDAVRSSRARTVKCSGLRWLSVMVLAEVPFARRIWALPFLTRLCPSERFDEKRGRNHLSLAERAARSLLLIKQWLPTRHIVAVGDSSFAVLDLLHKVRNKVTMVTRLRLDAALYEPAPERTKETMGRPRKKGRRLPTLTAIADSGHTIWRRLKVSQWYGEGEREIEIVSNTCVWFHIGRGSRPDPLCDNQRPVGEIQNTSLALNGSGSGAGADSAVVCQAMAN